MATVAWDVFLRGKLIDTVFWSTPCTADEVKRSLINHDGYNADIVVRRARKQEAPVPKLPVFRKCGDDAAMVVITGDPRNAEPTHVRIVFPGGEVEVTRASNGADADYWCHVKTVHPKDDDVKLYGERASRVTDGRIDVRGKHASESDAGDLNNPELYHLAVRVTRVKP